VTNGPKDHVNEQEDFDTWRAQHHQSYTTPISTTMPSDHYISNYYGTSFPYQTPFGVGDATWSNSGDHMTFLGGYGGQMGPDSYGMDGIYSAFGQAAAAAPAAAAAAAGFNYFHGGTAATAPRKPHYDEYYRQPSVETLKGIEQGMQGLGLTGVEVNKGSDGKDKEAVGVGGGGGGGGGGNQPKKVGSAGVKKKGPGMPPPPMVPGKHNMDIIGTWEGKNNGSGGGVKTGVAAPPPGGSVLHQPPPPQQQQQPPPPHHHHRPPHPPPTLPVPVMPPPQQQQQQQHHHQQHQQQQQVAVVTQIPSHPVLDELRIKNNYNPQEFDMSAKGARFFVIKSYSEDDIHRSIKYEIWCSTEHGNKRLDQAYRERETRQNGVVYLFFSVNGSGHFCGMAQMASPVDYNASSSVWSQDKWRGQFRVRWIYVKDVPNVQLRHIRLENNENKPVTNSRDTQEIPFEKGKQVLRVIHSYRHTTSIFDDFIHYERRQEEEDSKREMEQQANNHKVT
ncbi:hypothetical protein AAG570_010044, partial [Ranatra chinensis]